MVQLLIDFNGWKHRIEDDDASQQALPSRMSSSTWRLTNKRADQKLFGNQRGRRRDKRLRNTGCRAMMHSEWRARTRQASATVESVRGSNAVSEPKCPRSFKISGRVNASQLQGSKRPWLIMYCPGRRFRLQRHAVANPAKGGDPLDALNDGKVTTVKASGTGWKEGNAVAGPKPAGLDAPPSALPPAKVPQLFHHGDGVVVELWKRRPARETARNSWRGELDANIA